MAVSAVHGRAICKHGPPAANESAMARRPLVLVIGDSVSLGYTPFVATALAPLASVQHAPWGGDGGAEETAYGWECLDFLLAAPDGTPQVPDVLYFNFGLRIAAGTRTQVFSPAFH